MREEWRSRPLGEVTTFLNGLWKGEKPPYVTVGVIRNTNFAKDGSIDDSNIACLEVEAKRFEKRKLKIGDIILEKSGGGPNRPWAEWRFLRRRAVIIRSAISLQR